MENKESNNNNALVDIIMRQTDYSKEVATEKLIKHKQNVLSVIREYMSSSVATAVEEKEKEKTKSTSQLIYGEIRNMMGTACANYRKKKEFEDYKQAYIRRMQEKAQMQAHLQATQAHLQAQGQGQGQTQVQENDLPSLQ
jgi:hypothetical protein